jgi:predicted aspartyl protease
MQTNWLSKFVACATLLLLSGSVCAETVNFTLRRGHLIVIPVTLNGAGPYDFLLDTGASTTLVTPEFAQQLRLRPIDRIELVTVAGSQFLVRSQLERVSVGQQTATGIEVLISELREVRNVELKLAGVLGQNFLAQFNYLIDYRAQQLTFEESSELKTRFCGAQLPFTMHEGRLLVSLAVKRHTWRLVLDSGSGTMLLFGRQDMALDWETSLVETQLLRTDMGSRPVLQRRLRSLQLGPVRLVGLPVAVVTDQVGDGRIEDGLLPTSLFQRIYVNQRQAFVIFNPQPVE